MVLPVGSRIVDLRYFAGCRIQNIDAVIFRSDPYITVGSFRNLTDTPRIERFFRTGRYIFLKQQFMIRQVVDTPELSTEPNPAFPVFMNAENDIIREAVGMHQVFFQMNHLFVLFIDNEQAGV